MVDILYKDESYAIIGACIKVHSELGAGFLEAVYQEALEKEFIKRNIPFQRQPKLSLFFDGEKLKNITSPIFFAMIQSFWNLKKHPI